MLDIDILKQIQRLVGCNFNYKIEDGKCVEVSLNDANYIYQGLIRNHTYKDKQNILELISKLKNLKKLDLRRNKLDNLPASIENLENLIFLDIGSNYLKEIPDFIGDFKKLEYLNISVNELTKCPTLFYKLPNIKKLLLHKNKFRTLDDSIQTLEKLESLIYMDYF